MREWPSFSRRKHLWLTDGEPLLCPSGEAPHHRLRTNGIVMQAGAFVCQFQAQHAALQCGARVYVLQFPHQLRFVCEVTVEEMLYMRNHAMSAEDALRYLRHHTEREA